MTNIIIICRAMSSEPSFNRWRRIVHDYSDLRITVIGDRKYEIKHWQRPVIYQSGIIYDERFRFIPMTFINNRIWRGGYHIKDLGKILKEVKPDLIYLIGTEISDVTFQAGWIKKFYLHKAKIALFTMRGTALPSINPNFYFRWKLLLYFIDAFYCHCPYSLQILRSQGKVKKPIFLQTQLGVPEEIFKPDEKMRKKIRKKYDVKDHEFLFGSISRLTIKKGLLDILAALPVNAKWKFMMIGSGPDQEIIYEEVKRKGLENQIIFTGYIDGWENVSTYINAMDCSVLMSKTSSEYVDTFALAVAQSMAVGLPVIVSNSGGLPYQVGEKGIVIQEGDIVGLHDAMEYISNNPKKAKKIGKAMRERLLNSFSVHHLNRCFYYTVQDIINSKFNAGHMDQQKFTFTE